MLEVAYTIVANILHNRLKPVKESVRLDHENQNGFRWQRGCLDSIFTLKTTKKSRRTRTRLMAPSYRSRQRFYRVPRELLWTILSRQGVPLKLVSLLKALHKSVKDKFIVDGVEKVVNTIIGVKQGDVLAPDLFIFFMATVMATWRFSHSYNPCVVRCKADF